MKTVTEVVVREVKKYIAEDGAVFYDEAGCLRHEKDLEKADLKAKLDQIECCEKAENSTPLDGCEYMEYHDYKWYRPKTREEADVLYEFYGLESHIGDGCIGQWVCIEVCDDCCWFSSLNLSIVHIKMFFDMFGYDVTITKKEEGNV